MTTCLMRSGLWMHGCIGGGNEIMGWDLRVCGWRREWLPLVAGLRAGLAQFDDACMKNLRVPLNVM
jgi:hypothetical protein